MTGTEDPLLATAPPLPPAAAHVWRWFCEAQSTCKADERITAQLLQSVAWFLGVEMALWERLAIRRLDLLLFKVRNDRSQSNN
jgi:hypothetical protein